LKIPNAIKCETRQIIGHDNMQKMSECLQYRVAQIKIPQQ